VQTEPRVSPELEEVISLRLCTGPGEGQEVAVARRFLAKIYRALLSSATTVEKLHHSGQLVGFVMVTEPQPERFGIPEVRVAILCDPNFAEAQTWVAEVLSRLAPQLDPHCTALLDAADRTLLSTLLPLGFGVAKLDLVGSVQVALSRLRGKTIQPAVRGVSFCETTLSQALEVSTLMQSFFLAHPELGWGGPAPSAEQQATMDARELESLERSLSRGPKTDFNIVRDGKLLGYFGFHAHMGHPLLGNAGGVNIMLLPQIQGQGLGKAAYLHMLEKMSAMGIGTLYGRTSNAGVIHIARGLGRRVRRIVLRRDGPFLSPDLVRDS